KGKPGEPAAALDQLVAATLGARSKPAPPRPAEPPPTVPKVEPPPAPAARIEPTPAPARDHGVFRFDVNLPELDRKKLRRLVLSLRPEGSAHEPLGPPKEYVVDLDSPDAETLLLSLKVHLKGPAS
ncbi:MAG TPA: hypothetical protein VF310_04700, partial [Vicinamibacteria bacterium]